MCRLTIAMVTILAGLMLAAPRPKEPPRQPAPVVGKWRLVLMDGAEPGFSMDVEYVADGTAVRASDGSRPAFQWRYTMDTSASPAQLDYLYDDKPPDQCIFKVEGDSLTVCYSIGDKERPKEFGQPRTRQLMFTRVKPKD